MIRVVVDVNVLVRAVINRKGAVGPILDRIEDRAFRLLYSEAILDELTDVLGRPRIRQKYDLSQDVTHAMREMILHYGECVTPDCSITACRDSRDNKFLEVAVAGKADVIVSGDQDLLVLSPFEGIPIIGAATFLHMLAGVSATEDDSGSGRLSYPGDWKIPIRSNPLVKYELEALITAAVRGAQAAGDLPAFDVPAPALEHPKQVEHGDFATTIALQLAKLAHMAPLPIAEAIIKHLPASDLLGHVEAVKPGFINLTLGDAWLARQVEAILTAGEQFGNIDIGHGRKTQVEFVSVNPTGPLHIGSARNAILGDSLASVLAAAGYAVQREYYLNDRGTQFDNFANTAYVRYAQALGEAIEMPEEGYRGQYMIDTGGEMAAEFGRRYLEMPRVEATKIIGEIALQRTIDGLRRDLEQVGIRYDCWFSERSLYVDNTFDEVMQILRKAGMVEEHDGAIWFAATKLGASKDEVLVRSDGVPGYFASDIAYHYNKFVRRGFEWVIDVWGADHQGHVPRMKEMMRALGLNPDDLTLLLYQMVTLKRGGEVIKLSKRTGEIITLREVVDEVGADAVRFFLLSRSADSQMDFDLELAKQQSNENPVFYVQYAHARIASILRKAGEIDYAGGDVLLLNHPMEQALIRQMLRLPEVVEMAAERLAPHHLTYYATELATAFHAFYRDCRVVSSLPEDEAITRARLKLVAAVKQTLARVLHLMGMSAPETM